MSELGIAIRAASYVPPYRLLRHLRRRLHASLVPLQAQRYLMVLNRRAAKLPHVQPQSTAVAKQAAANVATFFAAKHQMNVPQCFGGRFTLLNQTHDFGDAAAIDWHIDMDGGRYQLWRANLSFMGYLCPAMAHDPARGLALAAQCAESFTAASTFRNKRDFTDIWNSYPVAQRVLALSAGLIALPPHLVGTPDWEVAERFLRLNVAYLIGNLETELGFNHLERNLSALALYSLAARTVTPAICRLLLANIDHVLLETIGVDGVQRERSAMYQGLVIQSLRVLSALDIWPATTRTTLDLRLAAVESALAALTLGDDMPIMMNDAWFGETPGTSVILGHNDRPGFQLLADAGYVRLASGEAEIVFDSGPIGPDANPGHGHPDFLSVEMSLGTERLIVDPGTSTYSPGEARWRDRSWDQHNGPAIAGGAPVEFLGSFKVGRRARAELEDAGRRGATQFAAGTLNFGNVSVRRAIELAGTTLAIDDRWHSGAGDRRSYFIVPGSWTVTLGHDGTLVLTRAGWRVRWTVREGSLTCEPTRWTCHYNRSAAAHALVVRPSTAGRAIVEIDWTRLAG